MSYLRVLFSDVWPVLVLGTIVIIGHQLTKHEEPVELKHKEPTVEVVQEDTDEHRPTHVGNNDKGEIKHRMDKKGRFWCYYSYINQQGHHMREYTLFCPKHRDK